MKVAATSREDYLKAILVLQRKNGEVRSVDVARYLGVTKPSVSRAVSKMTAEGFLSMDKENILRFTEKGLQTAETIYERHCFFAEQLMAAGVSEKTANEDACRLEHAVSEESFRKLREKFGK